MHKYIHINTVIGMDVLYAYMYSLYIYMYVCTILLILLIDVNIVYTRNVIGMYLFSQI